MCSTRLGICLCFADLACLVGFFTQLYLLMSAPIESSPFISLITSESDGPSLKTGLFHVKSSILDDFMNACMISDLLLSLWSL